MKKILSMMLVLVMTVSLFAGCTSEAPTKEENRTSAKDNKAEIENKEQKMTESENKASGELEGEITFWHSFT